MKSFVIDVKNGTAMEVEFTSDPSLDDLHRLVNCEIIDICHRKVGDKYYTIVVDDEGLLKDSFTPSGIEEETGEIMLVGNLLFFDDNATEDGNFIGLSGEDVENIRKHTHRYFMIDCNNERGQFITACEMRY